MKNLDRNKYQVWGVDVPTEIGKLTEIRPDVVFIALHGRGGEDGKIQGYLETLGIKYTGCGVLASALGMNKLVFRKLMESEELQMADLTWKVPCVVKPVDGGSSVGVSIVKRVEDMEKARVLAKQYGDIMTEEYIEGVEVACSVLGNPSIGSGQVVALPVIEMRPKNEFFDYEAKYTEGKCDEICPAEIEERVTQQVQQISVEVFKAIGGRGYARVDFMIRNNKPFVLEINTLPGLTANSLLPKEAAVAGMSYSQLLDKIIGLALQ